MAGYTPGMAGHRSLPVLAGAFAEAHPPLSADEAAFEASRCLYCYDAPCARACPTHINIPGFIREILHGDPRGAARTILGANIFGGSCARVCPVEVLCEGACVDHTLLKTPVLIGRLQRFACDTAHDASLGFYQPGPPSGKRVAIVGAGPAGLTCAHELGKLGHAVTIYEARDLAGGLNTLGIAAYKISTEFALTEVQRALQTGACLKLNSPVDAAGVQALLNTHDAVFLAVGLGGTAPLSIEGEDASGVWEALAFVFQTHRMAPELCAVGREVVVIGGGNTAMDAANAAVRLGAQRVTVAYRRDEASMSAFRHEIDAARANGVFFEFNARPKRILATATGVSGIEMERVAASGPGRAAPLSPVGVFTLPCDMVIKALGQTPLHELLTGIPGLALDARGRVVIDSKTRATSVPRLFAGGDCEAGAAEEVVNAVQSGKIAAAAIAAALA